MKSPQKTVAQIHLERCEEQCKRRMNERPYVVVKRCKACPRRLNDSNRTGYCMRCRRKVMG